MERKIAKNEPSSELTKVSINLMSLLSQMSWHGSPHLTEFPRQISVNDQIAQIIQELWDTHRKSDAEVTSTVLTTFGGDKINSANIKIGGHGSVEAEKLISPIWRRFYRPRVNIHAHPEFYPFSIGDLLNLLIKEEPYSALGYFPAMMVVNEGEIWAAIRSKETPRMKKEEFWRLSMELDHRVSNDEFWQNSGLFKFAREYSIALYHGEDRNSQVLFQIPRTITSVLKTYTTNP